ncbi:MAG: serine hydrolase domain-containing protein [Salibacteraceae bacterium]
MKKVGMMLFSFIITGGLLAQNKNEKVFARIDNLLKNELKKKNIFNAYLSFYSPSNNYEWHCAKGDFKNGASVSLENPFYTASIGKTFTAAAIGMLVDQGKVQFNDPISKHLPTEVIKGLHVFKGSDFTDSIKISHLLQHTSGIPDYFSQKAQDGTPSMYDLMLSEPNRSWTPEELISFSKTHFKPAFEPGIGYNYTDTEYILLGMIIEKISGLELHEFFAKQIFDPLAMNHTFLNLKSEPKQSTDQMSELYMGNLEIGAYLSLSADWAGGGIVSSGKDLINFQVALFGGELVSKDILNEMQLWTKESKGMYYGYGLRKIHLKELSPILPNWEVIGHSGSNGTSMYYCPDLDIYFTSTLNQLESNKEAVMLMIKILMQCQKLKS